LLASLTSFKTTVEKLIRRFESDRTHYLSKGYSEAQARVDFISPFFKALGWDVENEGGLAHHAREVVVEAAEDTGGRPDYGFRVSGQTRFFVEAKAPSEELDTAKHIIQAKTYAWNTKQVFFVVLTDFEEFRFYDASIQPDARKPDEGLLLKLSHNDYISSLKKLWEFSKDRVLAGSLEAMLPRGRRTQRLRIQVDAAFLDEMTGWREEVAKNVFKNNPDLTARQLNEIVQRLLDRIVFIRIAEDRRVIEKNQLRDAVEEWKARGGKFHIFEWLNDLFHRVNEDFNGEIFKPHLSEEIRIDSEVLARIIERLYPPQSPYRFDVIGVALLGSIYERYLGDTIRVTSKRVFVEQKPEVRKAGGVYYTPEYIVDYIVKNTVGKIIEGKTPKEIEKIRILDPACGSGSFLIGAFQCLIDYHVRYLTEHPTEAQGHALFPDVIKDQNGEHRLSVVRKAEILKNNLFGVDIDPQAVEVTMMSLYLKALEGERSQLPPKQHLLPELKYNIVCGNSLIGPDFYKGQQLSFIDVEDKFRVNVFDWGSAFREILNGGGFDAVIGNPPYVRQESLSEFKDYFERHYESFDGVADLYVYFMEKGVRLLREGGYYSVIVSSSFLRTTFAAPLRQFLKKTAAILRIVDFGGLAVFENAKDTYVCIPLLSRSSHPKRVQIAKVASLNFEDLDAYVEPRIYTISTQRLTSGAWSLKSDTEMTVFDKIMKVGQPLGDYVERKFFRGVTTGLNEAFVIDGKTRKALIEKDKKSTQLIKRLLSGEDIRRWAFRKEDTWLIFARRGVDIDSYPAIKEHLSKWKSELTPKKNSSDRIGRKPGKYKWYEIQDDVAYYPTFESPKIIFPDIAKGPRFCLDNEGNYLANTGYCLGTADRYLLGILNSRLFWFTISNISIPFGVRAGEYRYRLIYQYMERVPIRTVDFSNPTDKANHASMVTLVERMLEMSAVKYSGKLAPSELQRVERELNGIDAEIDDLVFKLYGITDEERKIIEGARP
jgi:TaqI-like C-terminal specificity domain/Eco57I restriction-modification methylase